MSGPLRQRWPTLGIQSLNLQAQMLNTMGRIVALSAPAIVA